MRILIVDDEEGTRIALRDLLKRRGFEIYTAHDGSTALECLAAHSFHVMITDLRMPGIDGLELSRKALERYPALFIILLTAYGTVEHTVEALKAGVYHYLLKPVNITELLAVIERIREVVHLRAEVERFQYKLSPAGAPEELVGQDPLMAKVYREIERAAAVDSPVLITGETGTGKELVARAIHALSLRKEKPFVPVHCAAFSEGLIESELFGHTRGAFTGATQERTGRIRTAHNGTLFLDEVPSMSLTVQGKLLRVLQEKKVEPVGSDRAFPVDIRLISATNEPLEELIKAGRFRGDLYYRLNVLQIHLPPLRYRRGDIPLLVEHFLRKKQPERPIRVAPSVMEIFLRYPWYGNVRELENTVEAALSNCQGEMLLPVHLPVRLVEELYPGLSLPYFTMQSPGDLGDFLGAFEKFLIIEALKATGSQAGKAARRLGISVRTLERKIKQFGLDRLSLRRDAEQILPAAQGLPREGQILWDVLFQEVVEPVVLIDKSAQIIAMNPAMKALIELPPDSVPKGSCIDILHCRDHLGEEPCRTGMARCTLAASQNRKISAIPLTIRTASGNDIPVMASISPAPGLPGDQSVVTVVMRDVTMEKLEHEALRAQAITDSLTGLYNRRYFEECLWQELRRSQRYGHPFSLLLCDVDNFKPMNDRHGHLHGDRVLREVAQTLRGAVRASDLACRYGGDEFAILLLETGKSGALIAAEKIRKVVGENGVNRVQGMGELTLSIGVACYPDDAQAGSDLIQQADAALYRAKQTGKNRVVGF